MHLFIFFGEMLIQVLCLFLSWIVYLLLLSYENSLHSLDTKLLSDTRFVNIFYHSVGFLFTFLIVSFETQKILILVRSKLSIFSFFGAFVSYLRSHCLIHEVLKIYIYIFF